MNRTYSEIRDDLKFVRCVMHQYYVLTIAHDCRFHPFEWNNFKFIRGINSPIVDESSDVEKFFWVICKSNPEVDVALYFENEVDGEINFIGSKISKC